ncbi:MAG: peptidoglycan-associated lipoprotein Pal [Candidatus Aureabacteria bacterium]|nr:peptidoglycan-associated lipoprotein Pal [Candidatus Auribacterota bacterium]
MKHLLICLVAVSAIALVFPGCAKRAKVTIPAAGKGLFGEEGVGPGGIPLTENPEGPFSEPENYPDPQAREIFVDVHFDYNKSDIRTSERPILEKVAGYMNGHAQLVIKVEGHCDERGSNEYNLALGERRALSIRSYIANLGVAPERIYTISYGEERPLCTERNESCWAKNRRGHFLLGAAQPQKQ